MTICENCEDGYHYQCEATVENCDCERCIDTNENGCSCKKCNEEQKK